MTPPEQATLSPFHPLLSLADIGDALRKVFHATSPSDDSGNALRVLCDKIPG